jgi:hypothetical protein
MDPRQVTPERAALTTAHVAVGALALTTIFLLVLRCSRHLASTPQAVSATVEAA